MIISIYICLLLGILINLLNLYFIIIIYNIYTINYKNKNSRYFYNFRKFSYNKNIRKYFYNPILEFFYSKIIYIILKIVLNILSKKFRIKVLIFMCLNAFISFFFNNIDCGVFLGNYVDLISSEEVFLCSDRTPETDLWDSYLNIQLPPLPNRAPNPPRKEIPSEWGPGKPWGEGPNKPGGPNGPGEPRTYPVDSRSRDEEPSREEFFGTVLNRDSPLNRESPLNSEPSLNSESPPKETWESYMNQEQGLYGQFQTDDKNYRFLQIPQIDKERSIRKALDAFNSVQRGPRPRMQDLNREDRINLTAAFWDKYKNSDLSNKSEFLSYNTHKAVMRGKDYNIAVKTMLQSLGRL